MTPDNTQTEATTRSDEEDTAGPPASPRWHKGLRIAVFVGLPLAFVVFLAFGLRTAAGPTIGSDAPPFQLTDLEGEPISSAEMQGSPIVVNFWASWCLPCKEEAPALEAAWQKYSERGVVVVGMNIQDSLDDAREFVDTHGLTFPMARDTNGDVSLDFGLKGLPETFFIDHTYRFSGFGAGEEIGSRGRLAVRGAVSRVLLNDQIELMLERMEEEPQ